MIGPPMHAATAALLGLLFFCSMNRRTFGRLVPIGLSDITHTVPRIARIRGGSPQATLRRRSRAEVASHCCSGISGSGIELIAAHALACAANRRRAFSREPHHAKPSAREP
jgi:hypothetical protein